MSTTDAKAEAWECSNDQYHSYHGHVSNSMKEVFRKSRALYRGRYITKTIAAPAQTEAMLVGSALHAMVEGTEAFCNSFAVAPKVDRRTTEGKAAWKYFGESAGDRSVLDKSQYELVASMVSALLQHPIANELLCGDGPHEFTVKWSDEIPRMCRFDKLLKDDIIPDIKTANDPSPEGFAKSCASFGYHRQSAWYCDGYRAFFGREPRHVYVVVGKEEPHEVFCYELDERSRQLGEEQNRLAIMQLKRCYETGEWESPLSRQVTEVGLPRWAFFNEYDWE